MTEKKKRSSKTTLNMKSIKQENVIISLDFSKIRPSVAHRRPKVYLLER